MKLIYKIIALIVSVILLVFGMVACDTFGENEQSNIINAYDIAVKNGFDGTEAEWLESLKGKDGNNATTVYKSIYEEALEYGFEGSFDEFLREYLSGYSQSEKESVAIASDTALRSVVSVYSTFSKTSYYYDRRGNKQEVKEEYTGAGAGVIVMLDEEAGDAHIITNFHVIYDANDTDGYADEVNLYVYGREIDGLEVEAEIIGATATYDIAVLKVENSEIFRSSNLVSASFGNSGLLNAGEEIFAVGNPNASGISITSGIVSVDSEYVTMTSPKDNKTPVKYRVMRIDAAINGGNSGGGVFNLKGELVGVVNIKVESEQIDNIAYAIPSAIAERAYKNIIKNCDGVNRNIKESYIGIIVRIKDSYAYYDPVLLDTRIVHVVEVADIQSGSDAMGKLQVGDIIESIEYDGVTYNVERLYDVTDNSLIYEKGKDITMNVKRDGKSVSVRMTFYNSESIA